MHQVQPQVAARRDDHPRLRLRRLQGRGVGPDQGHGPHLPRPGRLRPVFLAGAPQLLRRHHRRRHLRARCKFTSDFQEKDIVFGGDKKLAKLIDEIEELFPLAKGISVQSECPIGLIGDDIEAVVQEAPPRNSTSPSFPCAAKVSAACRSRWATTSPTTPSATGSSTPATAPSPSRRTPYDVAIIGDYNIGGDAWSSRILLEEMGLRVIAQWSGDGTLAEIESDPQGQAEPDPLLPLDELHLPAHGREVRHPVDGVQLLRPDQDRRILRKIAALLRRHHQGKAERVIAKYEPMMRGGHRQVPAAPRRQEGHALRRRPASAPRHRRLRRPGHGSGRHRLRVRATTTTMSAPSQDMGDAHADLRRRHRLRVRGVRQEASSPTWSAPASRRSTSSRRWAFPSARCTSWDYSGPYHGYDGFADLRPRHGHDDQQPVLEQARGAVEEAVETNEAAAKAAR